MNSRVKGKGESIGDRANKLGTVTQIIPKVRQEHKTIHTRYVVLWDDTNATSEVTSRSLELVSVSNFVGVFGMNSTF